MAVSRSWPSLRFGVYIRAPNFWKLPYAVLFSGKPPCMIPRWSKYRNMMVKGTRNHWRYSICDLMPPYLVTWTLWDTVAELSSCDLVDRLEGLRTRLHGRAEDRAADFEVGGDSDGAAIQSACSSSTADFYQGCPAQASGRHYQHDARGLPKPAHVVGTGFGLEKCS